MKSFIHTFTTFFNEYILFIISVESFWQKLGLCAGDEQLNL